MVSRTFFDPLPPHNGHHLQRKGHLWLNWIFDVVTHSLARSYDPSPLFFTPFRINCNFVIPGPHCHLLDFVSYAPYNDIICQHKAFILPLVNWKHESILCLHHSEETRVFVTHNQFGYSYFYLHPIKTATTGEDEERASEDCTNSILKSTGYWKYLKHAKLHLFNEIKKESCLNCQLYILCCIQ